MDHWHNSGHVSRRYACLLLQAHIFRRLDYRLRRLRGCRPLNALTVTPAPMAPPSTGRKPAAAVRPPTGPPTPATTEEPTPSTTAPPVSPIAPFLSCLNAFLAMVHAPDTGLNTANMKIAPNNNITNESIPKEMKSSVAKKMPTIAVIKPDTSKASRLLFFCNILTNRIMKPTIRMPNMNHWPVRLLTACTNSRMLLLPDTFKRSYGVVVALTIVTFPFLIS